jgi:hypothetical protein
MKTVFEMDALLHFEPGSYVCPCIAKLRACACACMSKGSWPEGHQEGVHTSFRNQFNCHWFSNSTWPVRPLHCAVAQQCWRLIYDYSS